jgi:Xaa-Pro aminopeptidase
LIGNLTAAQEFMREAGIDGWLTRDYRYSNPIFWQALGREIGHLTRPVWLMVPANGEPSLLAHDIDAARFPEDAPKIRRFANRETMVLGLQELLRSTGSDTPKLAMEYSELYQLPRVGRVDAGTIELVRSLGAKVVSSGDVLQHATERWSEFQLETHRFAVERLTRIVKEAYAFAGENIRWKLTEHDLAEHIRGRFDRLGLEYPDGPTVAFNEHSSDPHYEAKPGSSAVIRRDGWLLIDLWGRKKLAHGKSDERAISADITWVAKLGGPPTDKQAEVFNVVKNARDAAFDFLDASVLEGRYPEGWEVDRVAREVIGKAGYGDYFIHRLGHSLGYEVHSNGVNLDDWETHDTRKVIDGIGITMEPGIYLPEFGVRLEMDVYMGPDGPEITGERQDEIVRVET